MCIDAPESTTNSRSSGVFEVGVDVVLTSIGEENVAGKSLQILPTITSDDHVSHAASRPFVSYAPGPCCEANAEAVSLDGWEMFAVALVHAGLTSSSRRSVPEIKTYPQSVRRLAVALVHVRSTSSSRWSLPEIDANPEFVRRLANALVHVRPTSLSRRSLPEIEVSSQSVRRLAVALVHVRPVSPSHGYVHFLLFQKGSLLCFLIFWRVSSRQSVPSLLVQERTIALLVSDRICFQTQDHDGNYMSLLSNIDQLLSTDSILPPSFALTFLPFWLLVTISFWTLPHCLINMTSYWCFQSGIARLFVVVYTEPIQSEAEQNPAILTCTNLSGPFP